MSLTELPVVTLLLGILVLTMMSAYFSGSETAMMAINRYRLKHLVKERHKGARKVNRLLRRPDRLLGVILTGNNFVNNTAATLATVIGLKLFGDTGVALAPVVVTIYLLIFGELAPKTLAAHHPERFAFPSSYLLLPLLRLLYPVVWAANTISNAIVRPFVHEEHRRDSEHLSLDELRTVLSEGARIPVRRTNMLLSIIDLEKVTVDDIMVPRSEIVGIDIDDDISDIVTLISTSQHTRLPVFKGSIDNVIGILHLRRAVRFVQQEAFTKAELLDLTREPYFVPLRTPLHTQLLNFQQEERRIALVVDEYGDIKGIVTLEDILEEIVGEFTTDFASNMPEILPQEDGSYYVDGTALLRDINRALDWSLPTDGPRTLNGLILEHLEFIPESNLCCRIENYLIETLQIKENMVSNVKMRALPVEPSPDEDDD